MSPQSSSNIYSETAPAYGPGGRRYNDDLLLGEEARTRAAKEFPDLIQLLDFPELRERFNLADHPANRAKKQSHVAGFWAVILGLLALIGAASESVWHGMNEPWPTVMAVTSAILGIVALLLGGRKVLFGNRKRTWMRLRLTTERLRQFHFQTWIWRLPEIVELLDARSSVEEFSKIRSEWLEELPHYEREDIGEDCLRKILHPEGHPPVWLPKNAVGLPFSAEPVLPSSGWLIHIFRAYQVFRFDEQIAYAQYQLRKSNESIKPTVAEDSSHSEGKLSTRGSRFSPFAWYPGITLPLRAKLMALNFVWLTAFLLIISIHSLLIVSFFLGVEVAEGNWPHVVVVSGALIAIATKTLSEGFALTREIERYEEYLATVSSLSREFQSTESSLGKIRIMMEMERTTFEEMRVFLRSHEHAAFVL